MTKGIHHVGLTTHSLNKTEEFFTKVLAWNVVKRDDDYPAVFISDGHILLTLWQSNDHSNQFDRRSNVGLHHLALAVESESELTEIHEKLMSYPGVEIEFPPELLGEGPAKHMMCYEPSGIRIEFIYVPKSF